MLWVDGDGDSRFFVQVGNSSSYQGPPQDFGTLTLLEDGDYQYLTPDQTKWLYDTNGYLLSVTDRNLVTRTIHLVVQLLWRPDRFDGYQCRPGRHHHRLHQWRYCRTGRPPGAVDL